MLTASGTARLGRAARFGAVGAVGLLVNLGAQAALIEGLGLNYLAAAVIATQISSTANFVLAESWVFEAGGRSSGRAGRYLAFLAMNNIALLLRGPIMWMLTSGLGVHYALSNLTSLVVLTLIRFGIADTIIWRVPQTAALAGVPSGPATLVTVGAPFSVADLSARATAQMKLPPPRPLPPPVAGPKHRARKHRAAQRALPWATLTALAVCVTGATVLRLAQLSAIGFNSDEAVYSGQGAAMFGVGQADEFFSLFRAHPLLLQSIVGATFRVFGQSDFTARFVVAMLFGVGSVVLSYLLARTLCGRVAGIVAAATCAVVPYHVIVSRQVLVDAAMGFFAALSLFLILRWMKTLSPAVLLGAFAAAGFAALSKEVAVLLVPILLYALWTEGRWRALAAPVTRWAGAVYLLIALPFPLTRLISQSRNASSFFMWQFSRAPNHGYEWFGRVLLQYVTPALIVLMAAGVIALVARRRPIDRVVLAYLATFTTFFTFWPTKLFPYLFLLMPPLCACAGVALVTAVRTMSSNRASRVAARAFGGAVLATVLAALTVISWRAVTTTAEKDIPGMADFDVEVQSFAGTREFALWARSTPTNARFLTVGPSLGNILRFYGNRDSVAMSVSVDPLKRNPAYVPIPNPDLSLRELHVQYVVWDAYSADRSSFYSARTLEYARKFDGVIVFSAYTDEGGALRTEQGEPPEGIRPKLVVYSIDGGPLPIEGTSQTEATQ